jgi:hypothetical protein
VRRRPTSRATYCSPEGPGQQPIEISGADAISSPTKSNVFAHSCFYCGEIRRAAEAEFHPRLRPPPPSGKQELAIQACGRGETGRRKGLKIPRGFPCGFDPRRPHQIEPGYLCQRRTENQVAIKRPDQENRVRNENLRWSVRGRRIAANRFSEPGSSEKCLYWLCFCERFSQTMQAIEPINMIEHTVTRVAL